MTEPSVGADKLWMKRLPKRTVKMCLLRQPACYDSRSDSGRLVLQSQSWEGSKNTAGFPAE